MPDRARVGAEERSVVDTARRVFEAGQQLALDRLDLVRWDATDRASRTARGAALMAVGGVLLAGAFFILLAAFVALLDRIVPLPAAIGIVAAVIAVLGVIALLIGMRRTHVEEEFSVTRDLAGDGRSRGGSRQ